MTARRFLFWRKSENPYSSWPQPGYITLRSNRANLPSLISEPAILEEQEEGLPTLLIGVGKTGEVVLSQIFEKLRQSGRGKKNKNLRAMLIVDKAPDAMALHISPLASPLRNRELRILELQKPGTLYASQKLSRSVRAQAALLFQQVVNYKIYQEWLQDTLLELGHGIRVFLFGSLSEPMIGLIGDALQILRSFPTSFGRPGLFNWVSVFLVLDTLGGTGAISEEEQFAAIREIGRLTFNGPHLMRSTLGTSPFLERSLIDYVFLVDGSLPARVVRSGSADALSMLAEAIFVLLDASAAPIWQSLLNDLQSAAFIREQSSKPVLYSLGVATLYVPLETIRSYLANRLVTAAIFGERTEEEGLVAKDATVLSDDKLRAIVHSWLLGNHSTHPVFDWLLTRASPLDFDVLPDLSSDYDLLFVSQLALGLYTWINQGGVSLAQTVQALRWLEKHLTSCQTWIKQSRSGRTAESDTVSARFEYWKTYVQSLAHQLEKWQKVLFDSASSKVTTSRPSLSPDWRSSGIQPRDRGVSGIVSASKPLFTILQEQLLSIQQKLSSEAGDVVYRSVVVGESGSITDEIEKYYTDTIRPELTTAYVSGRIYRNIRERLEWWIQIRENQMPELFLVCWPANAQGRSQPLPSYCFRPDQIQGSEQARGLLDALLDLANSQLSSVERDLTTQWFGNQVRMRADFLRRASEVYLSYDHNITYQYRNTGVRRSYIISPNKTLSLSLQADIFPEARQSEIHVIEGGSPLRFSSLTILANLPFDAVNKLKELEKRYLQGPADSYYLYPQEQAAAAYETRWWRLRRQRILIPPEVTILLAEPRLVSLFCQALYNGLITRERSIQGGSFFWRVLPLPVESDEMPEFQALELAPVQADGLLLALRKFALELPNSSDAQLNPQHPFSAARKERYIALLRSEIEKRRSSPAAHQARQQILLELESWKQRAASDGNKKEIVKAFWAILDCEWEEPLWWKQ